ncbi:MAG: hemolysin III family protein [Pseudomonadota bacterium]
MAARIASIYTRAEYISDAIVHITGLVAALIAVPVIITLTAVWSGDGGTITAMSIYGVCLIAMLGCSALYNMVLRPSWRDLLRRIDQSAIYVKIAGTYTPFVALTGSQAGLFLAGIWGVAFTGVSLILFARGRARVASLILYLGLGWAGAIWGGPLVAGLSTPGFILLLIGGLTYTAGVLFLLWESLPFHNTIWHIFVLAATGICYASVMVELAHASGI